MLAASVNSPPSMPVPSTPSLAKPTAQRPSADVPSLFDDDSAEIDETATFASLMENPLDEAPPEPSRVSSTESTVSQSLHNESTQHQSSVNQPISPSLDQSLNETLSQSQPRENAKPINPETVAPQINSAETDANPEARVRSDSTAASVDSASTTVPLASATIVETDTPNETDSLVSTEDTGADTEALPLPAKPHALSSQQRIDGLRHSMDASQETMTAMTKTSANVSEQDAQPSPISRPPAATNASTDIFTLNGAATESHSSATITPPMSKTFPVSQVSDQLATAILQKSQITKAEGSIRFETLLDPPEIGRVWISIQRTSAGIAVKMAFHDIETEQLMSQQLDRIETSLRDQSLRDQGASADSFQLDLEQRHSAQDWADPSSTQSTPFINEHEANNSDNDSTPPLPSRPITGLHVLA